MTGLAKRAFRIGWRTVPVSIQARLLTHLVAGATGQAKFQCGIPTVIGLLESVKSNGLEPNTIIDIGAYVGEWSRMAAEVFSGSRFLLIEGNPENELALRECQRRLGPQCQVLMTLLGAEEKEEVPFYLSGTGSSALPELTSFERREVKLPMETLDGLLRGRKYKLPVMLKLDVQGYELEVLRGGRITLDHSEVVILETSLLPYNEGAPAFAEVVSFMEDAGFTVYDFCGQLRRQTDSALAQTDAAFVRKDSSLRQARKFWLAEP